MFEEALLEELQSLHLPPAAPSRRHPARRWIVVTVACLAGVASVPALIALNSQPAYAVSVNPDGSVTFTLHKLSTNLDEAAARLRAAGVPAVLIPAQPPGACTPTPGRPEVPGFLTYGRPSQAPHEERATVTVHPDKLPTGEVVAFAYHHVKTRDSDYIELLVGVYDAPGPTCVLLPPATRSPGQR